LKSEQLERERNVLRQRWNTECGEKMGVKTKLKVRNWILKEDLKIHLGMVDPASEFRMCGFHY
jgi:hypothetical protein